MADQLYKPADEKEIGLGHHHYAKDASDEGSLKGEEVHEHKLQRQLKNRHIAMIRYVRSLCSLTN